MRASRGLNAQQSQVAEQLPGLTADVDDREPTACLKLTLGQMHEKTDAATVEPADRAKVDDHVARAVGERQDRLAATAHAGGIHFEVDFDTRLRSHLLNASNAKR
jgi:hypothetical protein